jgi:hypothetical protein
MLHVLSVIGFVLVVIVGLVVLAGMALFLWIAGSSDNMFR